MSKNPTTARGGHELQQSDTPRLFVIIQSRDRPTLETQTEALTYSRLIIITTCDTDITLCMKRIWI
jgi:hypothetical protein